MEGKEKEGVGERGEAWRGEGREGEKRKCPTFSSFKSGGKFMCLKSSYLQYLFFRQLVEWSVERGWFFSQ